MLKRQPRKTIAPRVAKSVVTSVAKMAPRGRRRLQPAGWSVFLGVITAWDEQGPTVDYPGNSRGPTRASLTTAGPRMRAMPAAIGREAVLLIDPLGRGAPVLLGLLQRPGAEATDGDAVEARVDGRRVEIEGRDEIVLKCGEASITLRRNGRVVIRGAQVETRAAGLNRIRGGSVAIN